MTNQQSRFLDTDNTEPVTLDRPGSLPTQFHRFTPESVTAVNAALAAGRPLLVVGEPGIGKSQLARAVAARLGRVFVSAVIDAHTESRDLLWQFDAVQRLADAQVKGALCAGLLHASSGEKGTDTQRRHDARMAQLESELAVDHYLRPGPLWWAFDWSGAGERGAKPVQHNDKADPANGAVLLIDEIDKGQPELPNGLLEALGDGGFQPPGQGGPVSISGPAPLVLITSNEERDLPPAFLRRCLALRLALPEGEGPLIDHLCAVGELHHKHLGAELIRAAAEQLAGDRAVARDADARPLPGQAEFLDLLRALENLYDSGAARREALASIARYTSAKQGQLAL